MKINKRTVKIAAIGAGIAALIGGGIFGANYLENKFADRPDGAGEALSRTDIDAANQDRSDILRNSDPVRTIEYNGSTYAYNENLEVLLFIGVDDREVIDYSQDGGPARNSSQADLLLLAIFNKDTKTYSLLQINRDTMVEQMMYDYFGTYQGITTDQIALAHTYRSGLQDSCEDTVFAVSRFLYDVDIENYFCLTMDAIPVINDSVGGVTVTIEDDFSEVDPTLIKGETITLHGDQAEHYVRSRREVINDPTNINRMHRQRAYMSAILPMLGEKTAQNDTFAIKLFDQLSPYMVTDCTLDQLSTYIEKFSGYTLEKIVTPEGESKEGEKFMEFYVNESKLRALIIDLFYVKQG